MSKNIFAIIVVGVLIAVISHFVIDYFQRHASKDDCKCNETADGTTVVTPEGYVRSYGNRSIN